MRNLKSQAFNLGLILSASLLSACGGSSNTQQTDAYSVTYTSEMAKVGKSSFDITITDAYGEAQTGLNPTMKPMMNMSTHSHSTPYGDFEEGSEPGTYSAPIYYLMASGPTMGDWDIEISLPNDETVNFSPDVMMTMGEAPDTVRATLKGQSDTIAGMMEGSDESRSYYLFNEKLETSGDDHAFSIFLAAKESMMNYPALAIGDILNPDTDYELTISSINVEMSTTPNDTDSWIAADYTANGIWKADGLTGLTTGTQSDIHVRLSVNGERKTNDGLAVDDVDDAAKFKVTPSTGMSM